MRKLVLSCLTVSLVCGAAQAQTLFTYGSTPVSKQEFLKVYQKNSINKKTDFSEPALRDYLNLYSLFRMKVNEAELMHLDTMSSINAELENYRRQLARNYLTDKEVSNRLVKEAYDRMKEEVHVAHILISCSQTASADDTLKAYRKIDSIYQAITKKKADFAALAGANSDDRGTRAAGGDIGYLTALQTLYPFENAAFNTPVGKVSPIFRTQFGYHIVKVLDKRPARGEVTVQQIRVDVVKSKGDAGVTAAKMRADSVESMLKQGASFDDLVAKYSDDKFSSNEKGVLAPFAVGRMPQNLEDAAFGLKNPGDVSQPVKSDFGYHIFKLVKKVPLKPFDSLSESLKHRVENDSRAQIAHDIFFDKVKQAHGFKEYPANLQPILDKMPQIPDTGKEANILKPELFSNMEKPVFELAGKQYLQSDLINFASQLTRGRLMGPKVAVMRDIYRLYIDRTVNDYEEHHLADENPEFKSLMEEYRNGIMLFELMDRNVWGKASKDTVGLKAFYEGHKSKYQWEPGFAGVVYHFKDEKSLKAGQAALSKNMKISDEALSKLLNTEATPDAVSMQRGHYEFSRFKDASQSAIVKDKLTAPKKEDNGSYTVVKADEVYTQPTTKTLDEARGYVVAEYQDALEKKWNDELHQKYPVKVEETVFKGMVQ